VLLDRLNPSSLPEPFLAFSVLLYPFVDLGELCFGSGHCVSEVGRGDGFFSFICRVGWTRSRVEHVDDAVDLGYVDEAFFAPCFKDLTSGTGQYTIQVGEGEARKGMTRLSSVDEVDEAFFAFRDDVQYDGVQIPCEVLCVETFGVDVAVFD